ncbi:MAG: class I SAM-dependent methyltransferase [Anaerolineae bacterium]|nr:class I SAM-dependent methyltransferase [Anaerolineae bacterium]
MERAEYEWTYHCEDWHWWFVNRRRLAQTLLERRLTLGENDLILDVGCGTGGNLKFLSQWGKAVGIDLSPLALDFSRRRNFSGLVQGSGLTLPYPDHTFALVTAFDVLYHRWIVDDKQAVTECRRVLQPGGWLLLTDSALPDLKSIHDEIYYTRQRYILSNTRDKLIRAGFQPLACSYTNFLLLPVVAVVRLGSRWLPSVGRLDAQPLPRWLNQWLINIQKLEAMWLKRGGTLPLGSSIICLAQKITGHINYETS